MVAEAAAGPSHEEEVRQASVQELQSLRESLSQAEAKTRELEGQLENINKVNHHKFQPKPLTWLPFVVTVSYCFLKHSLRGRYTCPALWSVCKIA